MIQFKATIQLPSSNMATPSNDRSEVMLKERRIDPLAEKRLDIAVDAETDRRLQRGCRDAKCLARGRWSIFVPWTRIPFAAFQIVPERRLTLHHPVTVFQAGSSPSRYISGQLLRSATRNNKRKCNLHLLSACGGKISGVSRQHSGYEVRSADGVGHPIVQRWIGPRSGVRGLCRDGDIRSDTVQD